MISRLARYEPILRPVASLVCFGLALWLLHHEFKSLRVADIVTSLHALPGWGVGAAVMLTVCNYGFLIGYDALAVRLISHPLSLKQITIVSVLSYALSNSLGVVLGGTPVRARLYSAWGMSAPEIVRVIVFIGFAFWIGLFTLGGVLFVSTPFAIPDRLHLPLATSRPLGYILLGLAGAFFVVCGLRRAPWKLWEIEFQPPPLKIAFAQTMVASGDFVLAASVLYVLLPQDISVSYLPFVAIFLLAIIVALVSHVPGGIGVLELVLVAMLPTSSHSLVASLLAFRIIYYLFPLFLAVVGIAVMTVKQHRQQAAKVISASSRWAGLVGPKLMTGAVFVAGVILLASGSLPSSSGRMPLLQGLFPLPLVEVSHFLGSIIGALLLVLARGLQRRIDAAWSLTIGLLALGSIASLVKGLDYEEAILLLILLLALLPCRSSFYRRSSLLAPSLSLGWSVAICLALGMLLWLTLFTYKHVEYSSDLWWEFAYRGDAPRSLRALVGVSVLLVVVGVSRLLRPRRIVPDFPSPQEWQQVAAIVRNAETTNANLALLGDKHFVFSDDGQAFVMFGCEGKCWISMGDPVGPQSAADEAAWNFREACDAAGVYPAFYQVSQAALTRYIEMGLTLLKVGEEARVPLSGFSLQGSSRKDLRRTKKKAAEAGLRFEIVPRENIDTIMPQLKNISDAWLAEKSASEKGFSLGFFDEGYLRHFDIAVIYLADQPIAFANLWCGSNRQELSIDLMRYLPTAPHGVMEFLFVELMLKGHEAGYQWFNLGMAPLSGVDTHRLGPWWNRLSNLMYRHGEQFYNFQGLRAYKEKFDPEWSPKYLACPSGFAVARVLADTTTLIAGGLKNLVHS